MAPRLSSLDGSFLRVETPVAHMHVGWKGIFAPPAPGTAPVTVAALRASIAGRLRHAPRFRQRLAFAPGGFTEPVWVDDERFDLGYHVAALGDPGEKLPRARFDELANLCLSEQLDRRRPLWRVYLAPELEDGTLGLVMKAHHAMVDGKSAVELALLLLDATPDAPAPEPDDWRPARAPGLPRMLLDAMADQGSESLRLADGLARAATRPGEGVRLAATLRRAALAVGEDVLRAAPASWLNVPIGARRALVHHAAPLPPLLEARRAHGVTLNDVALAVTAGALRQHALERRQPPRPLKVMVPVSTRSDEEATALGNRISFVFVELPVHLPRPGDRLASIHAATTAFKRSGRASGGAALLRAAGLLPGPLRSRAARLAASPRMYNLTISNVPGPRVPVYLLGAELREAFPVVPLAEGHALSIGMFSYRDLLCFGVYADPAAVPRLEALPGALAASALELAAAAPRSRPARLAPAPQAAVAGG